MSDSNDCGLDAAAYAMGALEPAEADAFRQHLETCPLCRAEVESFSTVVDSLPLSAPQYAAPRRLRRRVMGEIRAESKVRPAQRRVGRLLPRPVVAAACVGALAAVGFLGAELSAGPSRPAVRMVVASLGDASVRVSGDRAELIVRHLPQPGAGKIYEVWLKRDGKLEPAQPLFGVDQAGRAQVVVPGSVRGVSAVLVTAEPVGGRPAPTSAPVVVATLS